MKIGLVYTIVTPELIELVEKEVKKQLGSNVELMTYEDATILSETREAGYVTASATAKLVTMYMEAVKNGADAILNCCSSVGDVADTVQDIARFIGVPIVRIDEEMCREAVRSGDKIGVMATVNTTLEPTKNTILRVAREMGKRVEVVEALVEGALGLNQEEFKSCMLKKAEEVKGQCDVILFAQGSMAYCEEYISELCNKKVLSSPRFGAEALKEALISKGVM